MLPFWKEIETLFAGVLFDTRVSSLNETTVGELLARGQRVVLYTALHKKFTNNSHYAQSSCLIDNDGYTIHQPDVSVKEATHIFNRARDVIANDTSNNMFYLVTMAGPTVTDHLPLAAELFFLKPPWINVTQVTAAFQAVEALGLVNHVTELDVSIYQDPGTCYSQRTIPPCLADFGATPTQQVLSDQATLYRALFNAFNRASVESVTLWGLADNHTWLNSFPVNRTNRPLLFDTSLDPKWAFWAVVNPAQVIP